MKTNSCTRILVLTFLFFSFSAIAQDAPTFNFYGTGPTKAISRGGARTLGACNLRVMRECVKRNANLRHYAHESSRARK
jgi:hypothetical protein